MVEYLFVKWVNGLPKCGLYTNKELNSLIIDHYKIKTDSRLSLMIYKIYYYYLRGYSIMTDPTTMAAIKRLEKRDE